MTSPFDGDLPGMPPRDARNKRTVSRLEFEVLDGSGKSIVEENSLANGNTELRLREQVAALERRLNLEDPQIATRMEAVRQKAREESRAEWEEEMGAKIAIVREKVAQTCAEFAKERARYFMGVEEDVVRLALAIASRVLHREANCDPLLLRGAVRVALEQIADNSATVLRLPVSEVEMWCEAFSKEAKLEVQFKEDGGLEPGECVLETKIGRVELGVKAQLVEIERGFFDLLQQRPA